MLEDVQAMFSDAQDVHASGATVVCSNPYDLGNPGSDVQGNVAPRDAGLSSLVLDARVTTAASGGTSVELQFIQSSNSDLSSPDVLESSGAIAVATLVAGYKFKLNRIPQPITKRYIGTQYVNVGAVAAINVTAALIPSVFP